MAEDTTTLNAELDLTPDSQSRPAVELHDAVLDAIFSALGVDEGYLDGETTSGQSASPDWPMSFDEAPAGRSQARPWILHVDDDCDLSNALKVRLESHGVSFVQAFGGIDGVRHAFTSPADAIILDYEMPRGNGEFVLRRMKQCEATKNIPIIVLTGRRDQGLEHKMLQLGADLFLNKPVRLELMLDALRQFVPLQAPRGAACLVD